METPSEKTRIFTIEIVKGPETILGKTFRLPRSGLRIGRSPSADLTIDCSTLSRMHVDIRAAAGDTWETVDLQSANGTCVNGKRIDTAIVRAGDEIVLAEDVTLLFDVRDEDPDSALRIPVPRQGRGDGWEDPLSASGPGRLQASSVGAPPTAAAPAMNEGTASQHPSHEPPPAIDVLPAQADPMKIQSRRPAWNKSVLIVSLSGELTAHDGGNFLSALEAIAVAGERCVLLDVGKLSSTDAAGLEAILQSAMAIERNGGSFRIICAANPLIDELAKAGLDGSFRGRRLPDENAARRAFADFKG